MGCGKAPTVVVLGFILLAQQGSAALPAATALYTEHTWKTFARLPEARAPIVFDRVDLQLLSAAIFHETNRRRAAHNLPPLRYDRAAHKAANLQAQIMARTGNVAHEHPDHPEHSTLSRRMAAVRLSPRFAAENLAYTFAIQYESGDRIYTREEHGQTVFSYQPSGPPIPPHTYSSFARAVLDQWLNSPGHRRNVLHREPKFLGVGCRPTRDRSGFPMVYCCQVFYAPMQAGL